MRPSYLLQLPKELRLQILEYSIDILDLDDLHWFPKTPFGICRQIREEAVACVYGTRDLILRLPDFNTQRVKKWSTWPSRMSIYDQHQHIGNPISPRFLRRGEIDEEDTELDTWPCHLFRAIRIDIPAPDPNDPAQLMMNWNRLRWFARILEKVKDGLPDIHLRFVETTERS